MNAPVPPACDRSALRPRSARRRRGCTRRRGWLAALAAAALALGYANGYALLRLSNMLRFQHHCTFNYGYAKMVRGPAGFARGIERAFAPAIRAEVRLGRMGAFGRFDKQRYDPEHQCPHQFEDIRPFPGFPPPGLRLSPNTGWPWDGQEPPAKTTPPSPAPSSAPSR